MSDDLKSHIIAPHENLELQLYKLIEMGNDLLSGRVDSVEEKCDGQNITFSVIDGNIQFFNKGLTTRRIERAIPGDQPGTMLCNMDQYSDPGIFSTFTKLYMSLEDIFHSNEGLVKKVFQNGRFVIEASIMGPENKNTITYDKPYFRMIQYVSMFGDYPNYSSFSKLSKTMSKYDKLDIANVPIVSFVSSNCRYNFADDLLSLATNNSLTLSNTIGELTQKLTESYLRLNMNMPIGLIEGASRRLSQGSKSSLSHRSFTNKSDWKTFQEIENRNTVAQAAIAPLEEILQRLAYDVFNCYEFKLSGEPGGSTESTINDINDIIAAAQYKKINASQLTIDRIDDTITRLRQISLFQKDVEGIVYEWEEQQYKLTGLFTPINKLLGYVQYGDAKIVN